ncbi:hypothetical protein ATEIFO6365_0005050300 [Aspergillus terreus]|uniref:Uncharacterized protein n=1 Tax=Aspergillus terreus TaxID=33178 RepID=A0A5M3Z2J6_ASPTE|nr:hypothetical protein ATETN484_0008016600 [Aspergillus terreus]GFF16313.1 hypothetical protein ATEIFO6365_0005050300 [Aspergillus terreus]
MGRLQSDEGTEPAAKRAQDMTVVTFDRRRAPRTTTTPDQPDQSDEPAESNPSITDRPPAVLAGSVDPNLANPRLLVNRTCIYERHLPANAYITAHVQRLQHGHYSSPAVSDQDFDHVDFLSINFVFHSPNTLAHRFRAATIRASVHCGRDSSAGPARSRNPRFLKHAPHLLYGTVSPETLQWNYSLTGSLGVAELPVMASISPAGGINGRYRRYEMMRIQGSVRSLPSPRGRRFDADAAQLVWSLEENNLQRSGLPREFTFAMLIQKPRADSRVHFALDIDPILQLHCSVYPAWWLRQRRYRPVPRRPVDFRVEVGQRFEPVPADGASRGFNFAALESSFDDYVHMPGKRFASGIPILPDDTDGLPDNPPNAPGDYSMVQPVSGMPQLPFPAGGMAAMPGRVPVNAAAGPMMPPGFNTGALPMRTILASNGQN